MCVDEEMIKLTITLNTIQAVLADVEDKHLELSLSIRNWLSKFHDIAYELDDMLDECLTHASKLKTKKFSN